MISILIIILKVIFLLGFLIFIHEGGHFLVAKLCKIKVNEFAIGFGPTIWKRQKGDTKYALRLIPLGGFVSMEGEDERSERSDSFSKASIPKRMAIIVAGGLVNIIFGLVIYFALVSFSGNYVSQTIESVKEEYGAAQAGVQSKDQVIKINDKKIHNKADIDEAMEESKGEMVTLQVKRDNTLLEIPVKPTAVSSKDTGIYLGAQGEELTTKIVALYPGSPAEKKGIQVNDVILKVNGKEVGNDPYKVVEEIKESEKEIITFTIQRKDEVLEIEVTPNTIYTYLLGIQFKKAENTIGNNIYYGFWDTTDFAFSIVDNLKMLFTGQVSTNQLMGPIGISGIVANTKGIADFIYLLALISLSLGVTNLLPFPPLDGGKVVIYLIEAIRRKPMKEKTEVMIQSVGFVVLIGLTILVTYNDILRIF